MADEKFTKFVRFVICRPELNSVIFKFLGPKGAPENLFERLGAVKTDGHSVAVRPLLQLSWLPEILRKCIPKQRRQDKGHVAITMTCEARKTSEKLQHERRSRARQRCD